MTKSRLISNDASDLLDMDAPSITPSDCDLDSDVHSYAQDAVHRRRQRFHVTKRSTSVRRGPTRQLSDSAFPGLHISKHKTADFAYGVSPDVTPQDSRLAILLSHSFVDNTVKRINSCYTSKSVCQGLYRTRDIELPAMLQYDFHLLEEHAESGEELRDFEELSAILSHISQNKMVSVQPQVLGSGSSTHPIVKIGMVLSGGPAPGGHNVIAGVFDYLYLRNTQSQLIGFHGGLDGLMGRRHEIVTPEIMDTFRNMGGFNMFLSGRGKVSGPDDLDRAVEVVNDLDLDGLIVVGGDGSNSNAALLANHFASRFPGTVSDGRPVLRKQCCVVGVPKTVDGDVQSYNIEVSFGFDTAARTYSELIGNLCTDASSTHYTYHFIRVMGRSASHLALECGMQTHPNVVLIGEEVRRKQQSLSMIVDYIVDLMEKRYSMGKPYGVVLIPEGLIEFIPEINVLITELNEILSKSDGPVTHVAPESLPKSRATWSMLPDSIREQLLMDRDATGYVMLAKIATERLLLMMVEARISERKLTHLSSLRFMPHYFGYEGRCAMPSDFDASYCYSLGYNAGVLISAKRNGYMSVIRDLKSPIEEWMPLGVPFLHLMHMITMGGKRVPAIRKTLLNLDGKLFKVFEQVREIWAYDDLYRSPGPIQLFTSDSQRCFSIADPTVEDLIGKPKSSSGTKSRFLLQRHIDCMSPLQVSRLGWRPPIPNLCSDPRARMKMFKEVLSNDPYTRDQVALNYPHMIRRCQFHLYEVVGHYSGDKYHNFSNSSPLKVGVVVLSKQAPGVLNVIWGIHERMSIHQGTCLAFNGARGLIEGDYIKLSGSDFELFRNQGGLEMVHRSRVNYFHDPKNWPAALKTCTDLKLDGLVILGDEVAMSQAALLTEYFLSKNSNICVIGVPVAGSNGLAGPLIESCVGFDSNAQLYAALVGNVLTDAVSMPKYWHFVKILGRYPSLEVLECALQTHPNLTIIAEEYGSADKTLFDVVSDIADAVCKRASMGKNYGTVLIPDHLVLHLPNTNSMLKELRGVLMEASAAGKRQEAFDSFLNYGKKTEVANEWVSKMTPWSLGVFTSLPIYIRKELLNFDTEVAIEVLDIELMLAKMVKEELNLRKAKGLYKGNYAAVTHYFGYQGRCCMPSEFDCSLAFAYGHVAAIAAESRLTGVCCSIRGLCGEIEGWKMYAIPLTSLMKVEPNSLTPMSLTDFKKGELPMIPSSVVSLKSKAFKKLTMARTKWLVEDLFINPGPIQFDGLVTAQSMVLITEHAEYYQMLSGVERFLHVLQNTCKFGVSEEYLNHAFVQLWGLLKVSQSPGDLVRFAETIKSDDDPHLRPNMNALSLNSFH
ncbi:Pyrophosphate--fructose 6-phosphate 1-phosphotransferase subunit beta 1 [Babesia sp. Xinjiang]|uniref:Pyrophosphate--fructose 6-phosphate 1-phosphotransferase subunit beta 1 n=1 Tax=Babesia sp. Xinjiang TaxID=462227 RepID=UPI000A2331A9|nr:Pyrophosphate--fructose 6-phosphate 1-phosphotransferase subunit beta 1 [Babesia sp. Xinjiang]ORM41669.1 Pyrophosphate--fructose 6-phosphate 1-phosphotransferase subunit beta 1 [Babesia sp. Xinjiang]